MKLAAIAMLLAGCSSTPPQDPGVSPPVIQSEHCAETNPYGVCCPIASAGLNVGQVTPSFTFETASATFDVCGFFDPNQTGIPGVINGVRIRLIHLIAFAPWAGASEEESDFICGSNLSGANTEPASFAKELAPLGVVFIEVLDGGTLAQLQAWPQCDPAYVAIGDLSAFHDADAVPFNIDIDARTLKIIDTSVGFDTALDQSIEALLAKLPD